MSHQNTTQTPRRTRQCGLALATALGGSLLIHAPARAQDASQLRAIQSQISALQSQLRHLQHEASQRDAALKAARADAAQARSDAAQAVRATASYAAAGHGAPLNSPPGYYPQGPSTAPGFAMGSPNPAASSLGNASPSSITTTSVDKNNPTFTVGGVTITLGGFIDATAFYRSKDLTSGTATSFNAIPYDNSVNGHLDEFRETAQASRFSMLIQGSPGTEQSLAGYFEGDLQGSATTSNSNQSNSYTPRMRLAYFTYDDNYDGWHFLAGQDWSMAVGDKVGITPRKELLLPTIDANFMPGFVYTRGAQVRAVKSFGNMLALGVSLEAPQETYSSAGISASGTTLPNGQTLTYNSSGTGFLNSAATYSYDTAPDLIAKAAFDPGFGHYEVYGLGSFFKTRSSVLGGGDTHTEFGGGVGGSATIPIIPKVVDLVGDFLYGSGVGRYGASQLPDATFGADGEPKLLRNTIGMVGLVAHPGKSVDLYSMVGTEQVGKSTYEGLVGGKTTGFGYGTPLASDAGCDVELGKCSAQTRAIDAITAGAWWRFLHGSYGTLQAGVEYTYEKKIAFSGEGGRPSTDNNIVFFTVRYLPFQ
jgi:hypothetical protein